MNLENLRLNRAIVHSFDRSEVSLQEVTTRLASGSQGLTQDLQDHLQRTLVEILGSGKKTLDMVSDAGVEDAALTLIGPMPGSSPEEFQALTRRLAQRLATSAPGARIQDVVLLIADGTVGVDDHRAVAVVLARKHGALHATANDGISLIKDLFLGGANKINKIALFSRSTHGAKASEEEWSVAVYDEQNATSAQYFASRFLNLSMAPTGERYTSEIYKVAKGFLASADIAPADREKSERMLIAEVFDSSEPLITLHEFADRVMPSSVANAFIATAEEAGVPTNAFERSPGYLRSPRRTHLEFDNGVVIQVPWNIDDSDIDVAPVNDGWTSIRVRSTLKRRT